MRAPLPIMFAGLLTLALGGIAVAAPHGAKPRAKKDAPAGKNGSDVGKKATASRPVCKAAKPLAKPVRENSFVVLQITGDEIMPSSGTAIIRVTPVKRKV